MKHALYEHPTGVMLHVLYDDTVPPVEYHSVRLAGPDYAPIGPDIRFFLGDSTPTLLTQIALEILNDP